MTSRAGGAIPMGGNINRPVSNVKLDTYEKLKNQIKQMEEILGIQNVFETV